MARRPIFVPAFDTGRLVREIDIEFLWHSGMAPSQKQKNVSELHRSAAKKGFSPLLEVSTKSGDELGRKLSAFNLQVQFSDLQIPFESAYQGSKVFERAGPFTDLYELAPQEAKRDPRLRDSGRLVGFEFHGIQFPINPKTAFYDWLYLHSLYRDHEALIQELSQYRGFTDIEFNPERSINCQARACAIFVSLDAKQVLEASIDDFEIFVGWLEADQGKDTRQIISPSLHSS